MFIRLCLRKVWMEVKVCICRFIEVSRFFSVV